jgi:ribosomal-protein-alanine N-acetyltransferase
VIVPTLQSGDVGLRPLRQRDQRAWTSIRRASSEWLRPWEATLPIATTGDVPRTFASMVSSVRREARAGRMLPWAMTYRGDFVGQVTVGGIAYGSLRSAAIGYWIGREFAGRGITPRAVALAIDYCMDELHLHRVEISIRPENQASLRVVEKLGMRLEGFRESYLHIDGEWRDHKTFVHFATDTPNTMIGRLRDTPNARRRTSDTM